MRHPILISEDRTYIGILHKKDSDGDDFAHWHIEPGVVDNFFVDALEKGDFDSWFCIDKKYKVILPWELM